MKLLIDSPLHWSTTFNPGDTDEALDEQQEHYQAVALVLQRLGVSCVFVSSGTGASFDILVQKVTLDEVDMNELFSDGLSELFELEIAYAPLGGRGCDFALRLVRAISRPV